MKQGWVLLAALFATAVAWAGPAAWYRWESRIDARLVCAQTTPGEGWQRIAGPYRDAACMHLR